MSASGPKPLPSFGFLTVRDYSELGLIGGYLVLNASGRPLEFHCTAPVRANRAQEILYGPTLAPFLYGEQIAQTLISKGKSRPLFVCTDVEAVLAARDVGAPPLVLLSEPETEAAESQHRLDAAHDSIPEPKTKRLIEFQLAHRRASVTVDQEPDRDEVLQAWNEHGSDLDLLEPFLRLHEAIDEAQRGAARS